MNEQRFYRLRRPAISVVACLLIVGISSSVCGETKPTKFSGQVSGLSWQWRYDQYGRLDEIAFPGNVTTRIAYSASESGKEEAYRTAAGPQDEQSRIRRDHLGRLLSAEGPNGRIRFIRDPSGMPIEVRFDDAPSLFQKYDLQGRLVARSVGESGTIQYRYDFLGRLAAVSSPAGEITYHYHRGSNAVIRKLPNGVQTIRRYDDEGKLIELTHADPENIIIARYTYAYRPDGLIGEISEINQRSGKGVCRYEYNLMHRLTGVACGGKGNSYHFDYDTQGNLSQSRLTGGQELHFTSTPAGALASDSRGPSRVDERGHVRELPHGPVPTDYEYSPGGDLAAAADRSVRYTYNALGQLTSRTVDGVKTEFLPDPFADTWQPLWHRDPEGKETLIIWDGATPLVQLRDEEVLYRLEDHLGSVRVVLDRSGAITAWHDYTPYGLPETAHSGEDLVPGFAGLYWDPVARVYLAKARAYDPVTARFLQPDPVLPLPDASKHSHSLYAYSGGDPVNFIDRNGAEAVSYETVGFNHGLRWWDNYFRALDYHYSDLLRKATGIDAPLIANTSPDIRDSVVERILDTAWKTSKDIEELDRTVNAWRYNKAPIPKQLSGPFITDQEWQAAENYTTALHEVNSFDHALGTVGRGLGSAWTALLAYGWLITKTRSSAIGLPPFLDKTQEWIPSTLETLKWQAKGITDAWDSRYTAPAKSLFQRLDDFIAKPAYGDSIPNPAPPYPVGIGNPVVPAPMGVHLSTTGPGKRGGRGGGITWPPSWKPPGSTGRPPPKPQPPLGGAPPPRGGAGSSRSIYAPSPVGGVYLGGAAKALDGFDRLKGIAIDDDTGKLVLIGSDDDRIDLPPLRLDDVVTVFRAVFNHGESPSVSIDLDEEDPMGPVMDVRHGPGTAASYVGWILFQCDRVMKSYQLGEDNVSRAAMVSRIAGYTDVLNAVFFGEKDKFDKDSGDPSRAVQTDPAEDGIWERFWIVPAAVKRFDAGKNELSLFEVPLKVNTQKMRWKEGKLVDDEEGESSFGAKAFQDWFSEHYEAIADEVHLEPPPNSGLDGPVAIFHELRRIALITAIAEHLRDSGQAMPTWMQDYPVKPFPVAQTTPSLTVNKTLKDGSVGFKSRIFGGVNLAPADSDVHIFGEGKGPDDTTFEKQHIAFVKAAKQEAESLTPVIPELLAKQSAFGKADTVETSGSETLSAAVLPGAKTRGLAANRQEVTDMVVAIGLGRNLALTRYHHSFFDPAGEFGSGWTLDLPRLTMTLVPKERDGRQSRYRLVPHLSSPLGTMSIRFDAIERVAPFDVDMYVAKEHLEIAGVVTGRSPIVEGKGKTRQVLFRDGTEWHFNEEGGLVLVQTEGTATRYIRGTKGDIRRIVAYIGKKAVAHINLEYDAMGRIVSAVAGQAEFLEKQAPPEIAELAFEYGPEGRLEKVLRLAAGEHKPPQVAWTYRYDASHLTGILGSDGTEASFGYDAHGRLLWEKLGNRERRYSVETTPQGAVLATRPSEEGENAVTWTYDTRLRPVGAETAEGVRIHWQYGRGKEVTETLYHQDHPVLKRATSADGRSETTTLADGSTYELHRDELGQPARLLVNGELAAEALWEPTGALSGIRTGSTQLQVRQHEEGWPNGLLVSAPMVSGKTDQWIEYEWDLMERPTRITDSSGFHYVIRYDDRGRITAFGRETEHDQMLGSHVTYNEAGLVSAISSSDEHERREYTEPGMLESIVIERDGSVSETDFDRQGRPTRQTAFDGGTTTWQYETDEPEARLQSIVLPDDGKIQYAWNRSDEPGVTDARMGATVVRTDSDNRGRITALTWGEESP